MARAAWHQHWLTFVQHASTLIAGCLSMSVSGSRIVKQKPLDIARTLFILPPNAKVLQVRELSARLKAKIGPAGDDQLVVTRPGFRVVTKIVPAPLVALMREFSEPTLLTNAGSALQPV